MSDAAKSIIISGHICLDLIPSIKVKKNSLEELLEPGKLLNVGGATIATGGAVANTGLALHKLGVPVRLMGKVGDDPFGEVIISILNDHNPELAKSMVVDQKSDTSYTLVISPPGIDRVFLHCPGANDTFSSKDLMNIDLDHVGIFHFGYPPLMKEIYQNEGEELKKIFSRVNSTLRSLDMSMPDPDSESGKLDWTRFLKNVLPEVDLFLPSYDEISYMLYKKVKPLSLDNARGIAEELLGYGVGVVVLKLGDEGLYMKTSADPKQIDRLKICNCDSSSWLDKELWTPCFQVEMVGATGAGDTTIAGVLASLSKGNGPGECLRYATAVGACACEAPDATSGIPTGKELDERLSRSWSKCEGSIKPSTGTQDVKTGVWLLK